MTGDPKSTVLVVEDDQNIREFICEALSAEGLRVLEAADGEEAVRIARDQRPAAIVLDIGLPLLDGATCADRIREAHPQVPFIVVTAGGRPEDISRIRATAHITKPFDVGHLVSAVKHAMERVTAPNAAKPQPVET